MIKCALNQCLGCRGTVLCQNTFFHRTGVDADADGNIPRTGGLHDRLDAIIRADIARV